MRGSTKDLPACPKPTILTKIINLLTSMRYSESFLHGALRGAGFGFAVLAIGLAYAATSLYSDLPTVGSGSTVSSSAWNQVVGYANKAVKQETEVITVSGSNVGIGSTNPKQALQVNGKILVGGGPFSSAFMGNGNSNISVVGGISNDQFARLTFGNGAEGNYAGIGMKVTGGGSYLYLGTSNNYTSGITNEAIVIDPNGKIGIGWETVTNDCVGTAYNTCSVSCSAGKYLTGGGCVVDGSIRYVYRTYPSTSSQWTCHTQANLENAGSILRAYAICANIR